MAEQSLAALIAAAPTPDDVRHAEQAAGHADRFRSIDQLTARLTSAALSGHKIANIIRGARGEKFADTLSLTLLTDPERSDLAELYTLTKQQARGAWFLPERAALKAGVLNQAAYHRSNPWHALTLAADDTARVSLGTNPDALAAWAQLIPFLETVLTPITLRAAGSTASPEEQRTEWVRIEHVYTGLGIDAATLQMFGYGGGWAALDRAAQTRTRLQLLDMIAQHNLADVAARYRAHRIQQLTMAVLKKGRNGTPLARQAMTKALQPTLAAYFGGDWLAYLAYLGLPPSPNEQLIPALPKPRLKVEGAAKIAAVAIKHDAAASEIEAMLAAFMGQSHAVSPVTARVNVLTRWWTEFDAIHACHRAGQHTLWGLVDEGHTSTEDVNGPTANLYRRILSNELLADIDRLWDGVTLPRWPDTIVSEPYPHRLMADTLGPAVDFWHGVALTAWYVCEGPTSRTSIAGLAAYHQRQLAALNTAGTPVHPSLFDDLLHAEARLGPPQAIASHSYELPLPNGIVGIRFSNGGQRRDGFEGLRDVITRHRRGWSHTYLDAYLRHRWSDALTTVSRNLQIHIAAKGKQPTFRQFAKMAAPTANHWFNGNLTDLYTAIGEKAPQVTRRQDLLPGTAYTLVHAVYQGLGGRYHNNDLRITDYPEARRYHQISRLASASPYYVQISEALGRPPTPDEFGANRHEWDWSNGLQQGWPLYEMAVKRAIATS
ncbi:hypothetical protein ACLQ2Y_14245 [Micromonospora echinospora]|uniref:hypothetical protein n=1 Tax=Micromonospora echinospora TaxID=1877 RepID=UPI003CED7B9D